MNFGETMRKKAEKAAQAVEDAADKPIEEMTDAELVSGREAAEAELRLARERELAVARAEVAEIPGSKRPLFGHQTPHIRK